jgi:hypothetical protein
MVSHFACQCQPHQFVPIGDFVPPPPLAVVLCFFFLCTRHCCRLAVGNADGIGSPSSVVGPRWRLHLQNMNESIWHFGEFFEGFFHGF